MPNPLLPLRQQANRDPDHIGGASWHGILPLSREAMFSPGRELQSLIKQQRLP